VSPMPPALDPVAERSPAMVRAFRLYLHWYLARHFHAVRLARPGVPAIPPDRPLLVFTNHPSWWDPAIFLYVSRRLFPHHDGYGPMEAEALGRYRVLRRMGIFPLHPGPAGAATFLRAARRILGQPGGALWVTAEGAFTDARSRPVRLRPGIAHLARSAEGAILLPLALEYPFWNESRPEALLHLGAPIEAGAAHDTRTWTAMLEAALTRSMDDLAAAAITRDPQRFTTLLAGSAGVGPIYDLWRRARAWTRGAAFTPSHESQG
jgi:1-acyl-sn-glycerol-3-phosphate acyltransferase